MAQTSLKARYDKLSTTRNPYLERARSAARLTIPSLMPDEGSSDSTTFQTPWQSIGSRGTNNLASKILLALFPPNTSAFQLTVSEADRAELNDATQGDIDEALASFESVVNDDIEASTFRSTMYQVGRHLIVTGNGLIFDDPEDGNNMRLYPLDRFVVRRDASGKVFEMIATDKTIWEGLSDEVRAAIQAGAETTTRTSDDEVTIYTGIYRRNDKWEVWQEIDDVRVPDSEGSYKLNASPWVPVRPVALDGESYGRGFIEEIYGDLNTVDVLTQAVTEGSSIAALLKFLVDPNGVTDKDDLVDTPNGGFATGRASDISTLSSDKSQDLNIALATMNKIEDRLAFSFLLNSAATRDAERVTAEEIRFIAQELEDALGGIYSVLSQELQAPLIKWRIAKLTKANKLQPLPKNVKMTIITGLEALGRGRDHQSLRAFVNDAGQLIGPEALQDYLQVSEYMKRSAAALRVDTKGLIRSEEDVQARRQQARDAETAAIQQQQPQQPR